MKAGDLISPEDREDIVDKIEEIISETHDIDVLDRHYAENVVGWLERHHSVALRALVPANAARITALEAQLEEMAGALEALDYWFDTDEDVLLAMTPDVRADHKRQHGKIIAALAAYRKTQEGGE